MNYAIKNYKMTIDFNKLIDNYLSRGSSLKQIGRYYPSEIGGCVRKVWFSYKKPKKTDKEVIKIFHTGNMMHEFITDVLKSEKNKDINLLRTEFPIKIEQENFLISGKIDDIILAKIENKEVLIEVKSTKYLPKEVNKSHVIQLQLYMHATNIHEGLILYVQKNDLQTKWFDINYDKKEIEKIFKKFELLHQALINDEIPEAEARLDKEKEWLCNNCEYFEECLESD